MTERRLLVSIICLLCLAPAKRPTEPVKGATKQMLEAKASRAAISIMPRAAVVPPETNRYTLRSLELVDASSATNWTILVATSSGSTGRVFTTSTKVFGVSNLLHDASYFIRPQGGQSNSTSVTLDWDSSASPNIAGYLVYVGTASRTYVDLTDTGNSSTAQFDNLLPGTNYFFAATWYDTVGLESPFSSEVQFVPQGTSVTFRLAGTTNAPVSEFKWPPAVEKYVRVSLDYYSASLNQWVTNYASRSYTNPVGNRFFRYRSGDPTNSPNANNRAWQTAVTGQGPWLDIPDTVVQGTNVGPIRFQITNSVNLRLSDYQIPE